MKAKKVKLADIKPYEKNPRENEEAIVKVIESIKRYGYIQPITVDHNNVIITGHTRYEALLKLGRKEVNVIELEISEEKAREYRLADNKIREEREWDDDRLLVELRAVSEEMREMFFEGEMMDITDQFIGKGVEEVTMKDVLAAERNMQGRVPGKLKLISIKCDECGGEFSIERK